MSDPIYDQEAERALLGAAMVGTRAHQAFMALETSDFYLPAHQVLASTIHEMITKGIAADEITVRAQLEAQGRLGALRGLGFGAYLYVLTKDANPLAADHYVDIIRAATMVRAANAAGTVLAEATTNPATAEYLAEVLAAHKAQVAAIPGPVSMVDDDENDTLGALLLEQDKPVDWIIPGHLAREDRVVIVAAEGVAKTTLCRQLTVCYSGGLNPWRATRVADGVRVLYIDAENSRAQSVRAYKWIAGRCYRPVIADGWKQRILHKTRNDGVDLVAKDNQWFTNLADKFVPDVIVLGPAYKLMRGDPQKDRDVQDLLDAIDRVRVKHKAAVIIETHAPHGHQGARDMRPYGSSVWLRWPEIILGYSRDSTIAPEFQPAKPEYLEAVDARGRREERDWPDRIRWGDEKQRELPWVPTDEFWKPSVDANYQIPDDERRSA